MLKERARAVAYWVWTTDLVLTTVAFVSAWWLRSHLAPQLLPSLFPGELYPLSRYLGLLPLVLAIWTLLLVTREAYTSRRTVALHQELWQVVQVRSPSPWKALLPQEALRIFAPLAAA